MMTNWENVKRLAGPNPETFPDGENVYCFGPVDDVVPSNQWIRAFKREAEEQGLRLEVRETYPAHTMGDYCLFVVVP